MRFGRLLLSVFILATAATTQAESYVLVPNPKYVQSPYQIPAFDRDFFRREKPAPFSTGKNGGTRYFNDRPPEYDSVQGEEWKEKCAADKERGMKKFRECFDREKKASNAALAKQRAEVNARYGTPYQNLTRE